VSEKEAPPAVTVLGVVESPMIWGKPAALVAAAELWLKGLAPPDVALRLDEVAESKRGAIRAGKQQRRSRAKHVEWLIMSIAGPVGLGDAG
jgi:hypothetical protein